MGICLESALHRGMPVEELLHTCRELGADGVELASRHLPPDGPVQVKEAARRAGVEVSSYNIATDLVGADADAQARRREADLQDSIRTIRELWST